MDHDYVTAKNAIINLIGKDIPEDVSYKTIEEDVMIELNNTVQKLNNKYSA